MMSAFAALSNSSLHFNLHISVNALPNSEQALRYLYRDEQMDKLETDVGGETRSDFTIKLHNFDFLFFMKELKITFNAL